MPELILTAACYLVAAILGRLARRARGVFPRHGVYLLVLFASALGTAQLMAVEIPWRPPQTLVHFTKMTAALAALGAAGFLLSAGRSPTHGPESATDLGPSADPENASGDGSASASGYHPGGRDPGEPQALQDQLQLARRGEAVGQLVGGVAHDFNNHLTVISGYSDLLQSRLEEGSPSWQQAEEIRQASSRAAAVTQQLLAFTRVGAIETERVDPNTVVEDLTKMMGRLLGEDIEVEMALDAETPPIEGGPGQLEHIVLGIASRARSEMPRGGRFVIATRPIELSEDGEAQRRTGLRSGKYALLSADWHPARREAAQGGSDRKGPAGAGSRAAQARSPSSVWDAVVQTAAEMGGGLWCLDRRGCFGVEVYLPALAPTIEGQPQEPAPAQREKDSGAVLVVEDDHEVRSLIQAVLEEQGFQVLAAQDAFEARELAAVHSGSIVLLLTDVVMPAMSGPALASDLSRKLEHLKVLFISGYARQRIIDHGFEPGAAFLRKPFDPAELADMVRQVLASSR